jgi:protein phosphatase
MTGLSWTSYGITHIGKLRKINQDNLLVLPEQQLWLVADGMGGHQDGEYASQAIAEALKSYKPAKTLGATFAMIYQKLVTVNTLLVDMAAKNSANCVIGSTVALLFIWHQQSICLWSGDSRIYLFRRGKLTQLSRDHNHASKLRMQGYNAEEISNQPYLQTLTHAIGGDSELYLEIQIQQLKSGDIFLLCSDGLNKEVSDTTIEAILTTRPIEEAAAQLVKQSLAAEGRDNITVVVCACSY